MKKEVSSEEKLLNLIRKKNPADKKESVPKETKADLDVSLPSVRELPDFRKLFVQIFLVFCLACTIYIGSNYFLLKEPPEVAVVPSSDDREDIVAADEVLPEPKPFTEYAEIIGKRDIFTSPFQRMPQESSNASEVPPAPAFDLSQNFKVVGIILDKDPKAVIEDVRNRRTLFLSYGDKLEGGTLEEIRDGKVIFLFNGQRVELMP